MEYTGTVTCVLCTPNKNFEATSDSSETNAQLEALQKLLDHLAKEHSDLNEKDN